MNNLKCNDTWDFRTELKAISYEFVTVDGNTPDGCVIRPGDIDPITGEVISKEFFEEYRKILHEEAIMNIEAERLPYSRKEQALRRQQRADIAAELERYLTPVPKCTLLADGRLLRYDSVKVMGIINVTPDSFYAASRKNSLDAILKQAEQMLAEGAAVLDIGGESTRPGSDPVSAEEERRRVLPAVSAIKQRFPESIISVDTYRAALAKEAMQCGGDIINDISAMTADTAMADVAAESKAPVILMHRKGTSRDMQQQCEYINVVQEVTEYLLGRAGLLAERQIGADKIILDPGIGFAKNDEQNLRLIQNLNALTVNAYPVLMAASRKTTIGKVLDTEQPLPPEERLEGALAVTASAVYAGASLIRVHDVKENVRLIRMLEAIRKV